MGRLIINPSAYLTILLYGASTHANKDAKIYVGRSTTVKNLLFCAHSYTMHELSKKNKQTNKKKNDSIG